MSVRVDNGAEFLDDFYGHPEWRGLIDMKVLDMGSPWNCILGQLFGSFSTGCDRLGIHRTSDRVMRGFDVGGFTGMPIRYGELTQEWVRYLSS